ncbi:hypothetical protein Gotri_007607 [Gossypium trilobum]|uniref:Uncharacterized protein n=1 Tax=Gossypium trilobum TaxID=34281 RepID=A0A7J9EGM8_9ROSI|nr:hypothetical protein [Gossypium trilobum]
MVFCKEIWTLVRYHQLERFCITPKEITVIPVVQKFYTSFKDQETTKKRQGGSWDTVTVRGEEGGGRRNYRSDATLPANFNIMFSALWYLQRKKICVGKWIYREMKRRVNRQKRRKEKTDVLVPLNRKEQSKTQKGVSGSTKEKLDGMIRWMQKTGSVEVPSEDEDEMEEQDVQKSVDGYEATFQSQYSRPKGPIVRSPTRHTTLTDGTSRYEYGSRKGKAPIERGHLPRFDDSY